jgi:hypothetical protein
METQIIISLEKYNELIEINDKFQKAFDENKTILFHDSYFGGHSGYRTNKYTIVNTDTFMDDLRNKIKELNDNYNAVDNELYKLKTKLRMKKWYNFISI